MIFEESGLEDTVEAALRQIDEKNESLKFVIHCPQVRQLKI